MVMLKFVKWWWTKSLDDTDRSIFITLVTVLFALVSILLMNALFGAVASFWLFLSYAVLFSLVAIGRGIYGQWKKYVKHQEEAAQKIVDRLTNGVSTEEDFHARAERVLASIRTRHTTP
jgi:hypothetical protein